LAPTRNGPLPSYTDGRAPDRDALIHDAIVAGSEFLITDDERVATVAFGAEPYRHEELGENVKAVRLPYFVEEHVYSSNFDLDQIEGDLLRLAARPLTGSGPPP
jgi:hypothetical protein